MSGNPDDEKDIQKAGPLDLQITTVRNIENNKAPLVMNSQALRSVRVLTQGIPSNTNPAVAGQTIITNLVPGTVIKQDSSRAQLTGIVGSASCQSPSQVTGNLSIQRPAQITLAATPLVATQNPGGTYHVPRGPAVVANLAAPRSNVTTVRTPLVVTAQNSQTHSFVRPPRTSSPAQGAWLTPNSSNTSQVKGTPTGIGSTIRNAGVAGKPQPANRPQSNQPVTAIRPGAIISNAITLGQPIHSFKPASGTMQIGSTVTLAQVLPSRTPSVVYTTNTAAQFNPAARITVTTTQNPIRPTHARPLGSIVSGARLAVPISQVQAAQNTRMVTPQAVTLTSNQRISVANSSQPQQLLGTSTRLVTSQQPSSATVVGRLTVNPSTGTGTMTNASNILTSQARISTLSTLNLQSLMAVANGASARVQQAAQGAKVIAQPATAATIHLAQIPSQIKANSAIVTTTTAARTINVPASIVTQRPNTSGPPQAISIAKVFTTTENQSAAGATSVFIHAPSLPNQVQRHPSSNPPNAASVAHQSNTSAPSSTTGTSYPLVNQEGGSFFFETTSTPTSAFQRAFVGQPSTTFVTQPQTQPINRPPPVSTGNQHFQGTGMRFSSVMVVEQTRGQPMSNTQFQSIAATSQNSQEHHHQQQQQQQQQQPHQGHSDSALSQQQQTQNSQSQNKITSSPRPSILRKRDHEGIPLKAAKNLASALQGFGQQSPASPPSPPRPDSRDNGHSSGGSTTISATSSPGIAEVNEDSNPPEPMNLKEEDEEESKPPMEMSPRKKPRKQRLTGNDIDESHDDMQFISESNLNKKDGYDSDGRNSDSTPKDGAPEGGRVTTLRKPASASLLNGYRQNWKATHNHYQRYSDIKPKDERRPTIIDIANQNRVLDKVNGWKIHHISTQMDDLAEQEQCVYDQLTDLLKFTESEECCRQNDKEVNRVNELIKGNLQRIKIINDGMIDAKNQIMKVFEHKRHVSDILSRCVSKRNFKKRDKV